LSYFEQNFIPGTQSLKYQKPNFIKIHSPALELSEGGRTHGNDNRCPVARIFAKCYILWLQLKI